MKRNAYVQLDYNGTVTLMTANYDPELSSVVRVKYRGWWMSLQMYLYREYKRGNINPSKIEEIYLGRIGSPEKISLFKDRRMTIAALLNRLARQGF